jgi:hypothetical protein
MVPLILLAILIVLGPQVASAQTISIVNLDHAREAILIEAALTRLLRDDGYTGKGASSEGFVVLLHGMSAQTRPRRSSRFRGEARNATSAILSVHECSGPTVPYPNPLIVSNCC